MISYLIEFSLLLIIFTFFYIAVKNRLPYNALRTYIISAILISICCPLLPHLGSATIGQYGIILPELLISGEANNETLFRSTSWMHLVPYFIKSVTLIFILLLIFYLAKIKSIIKNGIKHDENNYKIILSETINNPCSFFRYILLPQKNIFTDNERETIIKHEALHIEYKHSQEKLLLELAKAIFWWHPSLWYFKRELNLIHEYQVDDSMVNIMNPQSYRDILLQLIMHPPGLRLSNPLSSHIKKRFKMMNRNKKQLSKLSSILLVALLISSTVFIHACQTDETITPTAPSEQESTNQDKTVSLYKYTNSDTTIVFNTDTYEEKITIVDSEEVAYIKPDVMPLFPGCTDLESSSLKLLQYLYKNITYPKEAKDSNIEGMVILQFVVTNAGDITDLKIVRDLGGNCGHAAYKVINELKESERKWTAGEVNSKQVNVQYTLPVKFKLG